MQKLINTVVEKIIEFRGLLIINSGILKIPAMADTFDHLLKDIISALMTKNYLNLSHGHHTLANFARFLPTFAFFFCECPFSMK